MIKQADVRTAATNGASVPVEEQRLSPYLCRWCRNGRSLNEAHEICLAEGRFSRFWPTEDVTLADVPAVPMRDIALGRIQPAARHMLAWFYLYLVVKGIQDIGAKT